MNAWSACGAALLAFGMLPVIWRVSVGPLSGRLLAQNAGSTVVALAFLLLAQGYGRPSYVDLSLVLSLLGPVGTLVCVRLLDDDLKDGSPRGSTAVTVGCVAAAAAVTAAVCAATPPGRALVEALLIGVLVAVGNVVATRALSVGVVREPGAEREGGGAR
ncbi:monovalent cation/H+ antiporter complex subunit F [Streptomyces xanthii]|uniref:monovalent cation/H+ antiporter complex subunit F n=1 Tax=Streptomyces xanthii TaxID=2768069 RepID=UPI001CB7AC48|nr:monovalent cation/H+ antiporter complex subunit F [Streptomyces xanthii]